MPEDATDRLLAQVKQVELAAEPAMIAALRFLDPKEVLVEFFLICPGGAVDALQLRVASVAAPIGAGHIHQLERLAEMPSRGQMGPHTQVDKPALAIQADLLAGWDLADVFGLVALTDGGEKRNGGVAAPDLAGDLFVAAHDFTHPRLDLFEVFGRKRLGAGKIIVEPGVG